MRVILIRCHTQLHKMGWTSSNLVSRMLLQLISDRVKKKNRQLAAFWVFVWFFFWLVGWLIFFSSSSSFLDHKTSDLDKISSFKTATLTDQSAHFTQQPAANFNFKQELPVLESPPDEMACSCWSQSATLLWACTTNVQLERAEAH